MGVIDRSLPARRHARASSTEILESASTVMPETPRSDAILARGAQCRDGMPRDRQQLTAAFLSESEAATALVPPRASMTESGVNMESNVVCMMQTCQEFATRQPTFGTGYGAIGRMIDPRETIFWRLEGLRARYAPDATDEAFAKIIGLDKSTFSAIKKYNRNLSFETACYIKEKWGISLDWLFYGELQQSAFQVMASIGQRPVELPTKRRKRPQPT